MKRNKVIFNIFLVFLLTLVLVGCGKNDNGVEKIPGAETFVYEAEHVDLSELESASHSGQVGGSELAYGDGTEADKEKGWSNGYYVGPTYKDGFELKFIFESDKEEYANFVLRLGSELGNFKLDSANFELKLNGEEINYGSLTITGKKGVDASSISFRNYQVGTNLKLNEGENTFTLTIKSNELFNGGTGGPLVDNLQIITKADLEWDIIDNPTLKGQA